MSQTTTKKDLKLVIVSGLSSSGKTVVLHTLKDADYFWVDNLPMLLRVLNHLNQSFQVLFLTAIESIHKRVRQD